MAEPHLGLGAVRCPSGAETDHQAFMFWFCCGVYGFSSETSSWREKGKRVSWLCSMIKTF